MQEISVIIPVYNEERVIKECLESIKAQKEPAEIIVVDDGSTDNSSEIILNLIHFSQYRYISKHTGNPNILRNIGFELSSGKYVMFLDADCVLHPDALTNLKNALDISNYDVAFTYGNYVVVDEQKRLCNFIPKVLAVSNYIPTSCSLIKKECFYKVGGFDDNIKRLQDWDLWLTFIDNGLSGIFIDKTIFTTRPLSTDEDRSIKYRDAKRIVTKKHSATIVPMIV